MAPIARTPRIELVPGRGEHRAFVRRLSARVFARFGDYSSWLPSLMRHPGVQTVVAVAGGQPIGFAMCAVADTDAAALDLVAIAVAPEWQSRGVGRRLSRRVEELALQRAPPGSTATVLLTVAEDNLPARRLFEAEGFARLRGGTGAYAGGQRSIEMRKRVCPAAAPRRG